MSRLTEDELSDALHRIAGDPADVPDRARLVRGRARRLRARRVAGGSVVAVVLALAVALPLALGTARDGSPGLAGGGSAPSASPDPPDCPSTASCRSSTIPSALRRPLTLPVLPAGDECPVSASRRLPAGGGFSDAFSAVGPGPVYLTGDGAVSFAYPPPEDSSYAGSEWGGQKIIWAIEGYDGPLLIRGAQLDGEHAVRFDHYLGAVGYAGGAGDGVPYADLAYPGEQGAAGDTLRTYPSALRLQAPGCYALQVDGTDFSETIVFQARLAPS